MTKGKFEVGKEYTDNYGVTYTVISRTAKFVTVYAAEMYSERRCKVVEDSNGSYDIDVVDIKYQVSVGVFSEEQIYCFSAMIIYTK